MHFLKNDFHLLTFRDLNIDGGLLSGAKLEQMMKDLREELRANPPVVGAYTPRRGDLCVARFSVDKLWYRARVEGVRGKNAEILYIDFGNVGIFIEFSIIAFDV